MNDNMPIDDEFRLPEPPNFPSGLVERCKGTGDFRPILFEWYKYVGLLANLFASLRIDSPAFKSFPEVHFAVLSGMLNRCSRLMLSNVRLSSEGRHGETTRLLDRCISETAIKVQWLCQKNAAEAFTRFLADGIKKDLDLKRHVDANVASRGGQTVAIETRMLRSIEKTLRLSGLSEPDVAAAKRLPDLAAMCRDIGFADLSYTAIQRMGSHAVHGTWSDLVQNYLVHDDTKGFSPRDHEIKTQDVQFIIVALLVLKAISEFLRCAAADVSEFAPYHDVLSGIRDELFNIQMMANGKDFQPE